MWKLCRPCGDLPAIVGEDLNTRPVTTDLLDSPARVETLAPVQQRPRSPASTAAIRTAPEYSNAIGHGRPRQTATGRRLPQQLRMTMPPGVRIQDSIRGFEPPASGLSGELYSTQKLSQRPIDAEGIAMLVQSASGCLLRNSCSYQSAIWS
jgi:hypothetical protein